MSITAHDNNASRAAYATDQCRYAIAGSKIVMSQRRNFKARAYKAGIIEDMRLTEDCIIRCADFLIAYAVAQEPQQ